MEEFLKRCESVRVKCRVAKEEDMLLKRKLQNDSCESVSPSCCSNSKHEDSSDGVEMSPRSSDLENAGSEISTSTDRVLSYRRPTKNHRCLRRRSWRGSSRRQKSMSRNDSLKSTTMIL
ncbi:uncharacterized protein LOC125223865 isoform X4 [Salvia hispanica]|uniref:uncharacterized protein LOC125223865 isoform X4 n=1 Tax=Salvia hispanica TaxID=49212 RepID=UPI002009D844|nr:uncharacterized protein LOC125223865 isoform X4 [Salvia hispanica]